MGYDSDGFYNDDDDQRDQGPKALRDALKAANKRLADLEKANADLSATVAARNLKDVLEDKGLRPGLARVIQKDGVDASDPDAISAWLNDAGNQEDFGFSLEDENENAGDGEPSDGGDGGDHTDLAAAHARMQGASQGALPDDRIAQARTEIKGAKTPGEIQAALDRAIKNVK